MKQSRPSPCEIIAAARLARSSERVARSLLGTWLISIVDGEETIGRIVETEAYLGPHDEASHAAARIGRTARNAVMFGPAGSAYVYRSYGIHWCMNVVTGEVGFPSAVLIRAIEPVSGIRTMRVRRGKHEDVDDQSLGRGPGNLTVALGITGDLNGHKLDQPPLALARGTRLRSESIVVGPRIGITRSADWPLRFHVKGNRCVSHYRR
ncbi:MAG: DNA-3-methyladenine glycosylase [Longimicrobiales bacterium]